MFKTVYLDVEAIHLFPTLSYHTDRVVARFVSIEVPQQLVLLIWTSELGVALFGLLVSVFTCSIGDFENDRFSETIEIPLL